MNTLTRTIAVLVALSMLTPGLVLAQDAPASEARDADVARWKAERAARGAQKQAEAAQKQADAAHQQQVASLVALERARSTRVAPGAYSTLSRTRWPFQSGGASVFVIPSAEIETKDLLTINEDINVMSRIFTTNLQRAHISQSGGNFFADDSVSSLMNALSGRNRTSIQSLYLQGYGVLFLMKVDFPLSPSHQAQQQDEAEQKEEGDKVWEDTRRQLYEPERVAKRKTDESEEEYNAEKVENLKTTLIKTLKHGANIRNLKPEESAILTITGGGKSSDVIIEPIPATSKMIVITKDKKPRIYEQGLPDDIRASLPVVLVIRAKKLDIDSFAKGDLDLEQFRQRVQMISYPLLGGETGRGSVLDFYNKTVPSTRPTLF